jgi:hypothetical protein
LPVRRAGPRRSDDVGLAHKAFPDQHRPRSGAFHAFGVVSGEDAAFGDQKDIGGQVHGKPLGDGEIDHEAAEVAVVYTQ